MTQVAARPKPFFHFALRPEDLKENQMKAGAPEHPAFLHAEQLRLLLFGGKGGVSKTTLACASALRLAEERSCKGTLLFSIDPAHSLAACLGREIGPQEVRVAPRLSVIELDAQAEYAHLKQNYGNRNMPMSWRESLSATVGRQG